RDLVQVFKKAQHFEKVYFNTKVEDVKSQKDKVSVKLTSKKKSQTKKFDKILLAVGRIPNHERLNLGKVGIKPNKKGFIDVNLQRQTQVKHIYAIGDLTGEPLLAHKASHEGRVTAETIAGDEGAA